MTRLAAVLFDLDDTLYPEREFVDGGFVAASRFLGPRVGRPPTELAARLRALHDREGRGHLFDLLLSELGHSDDRDLVLAAVLAYRTHRPRLRPFSGVVDLLKVLHDANIRTGLVSDGLSSVQRRKLAALPAVERELDVVVLTDELGPSHAKPSPIPFRVACRMLDVPADRTVYVANDPRKDFVGARAAGLQTICVGTLPDEGAQTTIVVNERDHADIRTSLPALLPMLVGPNAIGRGAAGPSAR